ncbi:NAD(P)-dependent alcohol dehydrogenase [Legionella israelensis]|uniref:NAD(P)-dependent alcohol dehydrogenase n=1 Tax=Legionella israelensis TaxID=454 RepID=UPI00117DDB53|nr:NAD(P)-dependent alcohol dehydrogenase [Legionella israelensis]QDP71265.1 NAD(P)-dependent alcohol dehydrogenase [Legionella israelensis]
MKAITVDSYGGTNQLVLKDVPDPMVADDDVLIRIKACSVNPIDWKIRSGSMRWVYPVKLPVILGFDFAGEVQYVGKNVQKLKPGDQVYGCSNKKSGGTYAELIALKENDVSQMPTSMTFEEAASVPLSALTALQGLRDKGALKAKQRVLIVGASGGVGMFAVQIAKGFGAHVTGVCSTPNVPFVQNLGADEVVDYKKQDVFVNEQKYDLIYDCVAAHSYQKAKKHLTAHGTYVTTLPSLFLVFYLFLSRFTSQKAKIIFMQANKADLDFITKLIEDNKLKTHIDSIYPIEKIAEAHQKSETHHATGKIVVSIP